MTTNTDQLPASRPENIPIQTSTPEDAPQSYLLSTTLPLPMRFSQKKVKGPAPLVMLISSINTQRELRLLQTESFKDAEAHQW